MLYTYILNIYDLVWLGFMAYVVIVGYLMLNLLYIYIYIFAKIKYLKIPLANVVCLVADRPETQSKVKLDGFRS